MTGTATIAAEGSAGTGEVLRFRVAVEYALEGDLRCLSHHDEMRVWARSLVRAHWPVRFSQGFNPLPRFSLPLPRRVGMASDCQLALVELREPRDAGELAESLAAALPGGCVLRRVIAPAATGTPHAVGVEYAIELSAADASAAGARLQALMDAERLEVERDVAGGRHTRTLDIKPFLESLRLDGRTLWMQLRITEQQTARPTEILTALGLVPDAYVHRVQRSEVTWDIGLSGGGGATEAQEGTKLVRAEDETHYAKTQTCKEDSEQFGRGKDEHGFRGTAAG